MSSLLCSQLLPGPEINGKPIQRAGLVVCLFRLFKVVFVCLFWPPPPKLNGSAENSTHEPQESCPKYRRAKHLERSIFCPLLLARSLARLCRLRSAMLLLLEELPQKEQLLMANSRSSQTGELAKTNSNSNRLAPSCQSSSSALLRLPPLFQLTGGACCLIELSQPQSERQKGSGTLSFSSRLIPIDSQ